MNYLFPLINVRQKFTQFKENEKWKQQKLLQQIQD